MQRRRSKYVRRTHVLALLGAFAMLAFATTGAGAGGAGNPNQVLTLDASEVQAPATMRTGPLDVVVTLDDPSVAVAAEQQGLTAAQQRQYSDSLEATQNVLSAQAANVGAKELASVTTALNAVAFRVKASMVDELRALPGVASVRAINDYELDLSETVPYIGAAAVQAGGFDGTGIDVAVLDSGIDYTHQNFGGAGTAAAYEAAYGTQVTDPRNTTTDGLFPTAKVVAGFDFVGEFWPGIKPGSTVAALHPDPDPIDCGPAVIPPSPDPPPQTPPLPPVPDCAGGHGSHVSDIILGNEGVAPGAELFSYKVCSAVSTSCSGVALLQAVARSLDPNNDGSITDRVDVINLSLGSSYGQVEDDLSFALGNAANAGAVVVASAGNSADRPYIVGSPSSQAEVISVAQTQVPSAVLHKLVAGSVNVGALHQPWSAAPTAVSDALAYDTTNTGTRQGCSTANGIPNPFAPGSHTGQVLLMDRGLCAVSIKVANAHAAGAVAAIVANNVSQGPGDLPPVFSFGGPGLPPTAIAGYTTTQAHGNLLKAAIPVNASINPADSFPLVGHMVSSSSRGPDHTFNSIKPDIGAPGASVSTEAGTGMGETPFGGTSGAAPMVSGSAALLLDKNSSLSVRDVKTLLMSTAETNVFMNPSVSPNPLAPITRIGGGEVRVDKAVASGTAAWERGTNAASLSFGYHALSEKETLRKTVRVKNFTSSSKRYTITPTFRYVDDFASGAVKIDAPSSIRVRGGDTESFTVKLRIDPSKLPVWTLNGGPLGGDGFRLEGVEFDGYINLNGGTNNSVHVAWQVLPRRSAEVEAEDDTVKLRRNGTGSVEVENDSKVLDGRVDVFSLTGESPRIDEDLLAGPGENFWVTDLRAAGVRLNGSNVEFAIDTFGARAHPVYPAEIDVLIDTNRNGVPDFILWTQENGAFGSTGQTVVVRFNVATGAAAAIAFADADLNSGNVVISVPLTQVGLTPTSQFDFAVEGWDNYFVAQPTDAIDTMTYSLGTPKFTGTGLPAAIPARGEANLNIATVPGGDLASPSQTGFLLMYRDAEGVTRSNSRNEADLIEVKVKK